MKTPRPDETAANVKSSQRDARSGSLQRMVRRCGLILKVSLHRPPIGLTDRSLLPLPRVSPTTGEETNEQYRAWAGRALESMTRESRGEIATQHSLMPHRSAAECGNELLRILEARGRHFSMRLWPTLFRLHVRVRRAESRVQVLARRLCVSPRYAMNLLQAVGLLPAPISGSKHQTR